MWCKFVHRFVRLLPKPWAWVRMGAAEAVSNNFGGSRVPIPDAPFPKSKPQTLNMGAHESCRGGAWQKCSRRGSSSWRGAMFTYPLHLHSCKYSQLQIREHAASTEMAGAYAQTPRKQGQQRVQPRGGTLQNAQSVRLERRETRRGLAEV